MLSKVYKTKSKTDTSSQKMYFISAFAKNGV